MTETVKEQDALEVPLRRLSRDEAAASAMLSDREARFLVDTYYTMQENRIRAGHQVRTMSESAEPCDVLLWYEAQAELLEKQVKRALDKYSNAHLLGQWARSIVGVGPVIAAGLIAHISFDKAQSAGDIWSFAGLLADQTWEKGQKRPWNASLKTLCWNLGESFVKQSSRNGDYYGQVWRERKDKEQAANERGEFAEQAARKLERFNIRKTTEAYKWYAAGKLPPGHIHARAKRYAVKLFLSHFFEVGYFIHHGRKAPRPFAIEHLGHVHYIEPPNTEMIPGW